MKAWEVVGYTADADTWCTACAALTYDRVIDGVLCTVDARVEAFRALDHEGNEVSPIFASDLTGHEACSRCAESLDEGHECDGICEQYWCNA